MELWRLFFLLYIRSVCRCSNIVEHHMTRDQVELPLAQTYGMAGALCGLSYEDSCLGCLTSAHLPFKAIGEVPELTSLVSIVQPLICDTQVYPRDSRTERSTLRRISGL